MTSPDDSPDLALRSVRLAATRRESVLRGGSFAPSDRVSVGRHEAATLAQIEKATRRLVAMRGADGSITRAANQLGMSHGALSDLKRVFATDVLVCDACGGAMRILAILPDGDASGAILEHLGLPTEPPPLGAVGPPEADARPT